MSRYDFHHWPYIGWRIAISITKAEHTLLCRYLGSKQKRLASVVPTRYPTRGEALKAAKIWRAKGLATRVFKSMEKEVR